MRMQNKKAEQIASRQKHRDQLKAQRRGQLILERAEATLHVICGRWRQSCFSSSHGS